MPLQSTSCSGPKFDKTLAVLIKNETKCFGRVWPLNVLPNRAKISSKKAILGQK